MQPNFLQQRLYPTFRLGYKPTVTHSNRNALVHVRQSDLDSACATHCVTMALILTGTITHARSLPNQCKGIAARLWKAAQESYFHGIYAVDLAGMLESLNTNLQINYIEDNHKKTLAFTKAELEQGGLVILSYRTKNHKAHHYILIIGVEGMQKGVTFTVQALLTLDPGLQGPEMCAYNGRMHIAPRTISDSSLYVTNDGETESVIFTSAVSIKKGQ